MIAALIAGALAVSSSSTVLHEVTKGHEVYERFLVQSTPRGLRMLSCLRDAPLAPQRGATTVRTIDKGTQSNVDEARQVVARTEAEWQALWKRHEYDRPAPKIDFSKEMVVGVFLGSRPTAGFAVEIVGADVRDGALVVSYREAKPAADAMTAQVLTSPYTFAVVEKRAGDVKFQKVD
jgi:hypothetical protein